MPTSPQKRTSSGGGRLRRLLASLRPPARVGPLPVQTGFPTSLADIVVKNHGRLRNQRRRHRATSAAGPPSAAAAETAPMSRERRELSVARDASAPVPVTARPAKSEGFSIRPGLLVAGGAVALALLVIWSRQLVAAATLASVALYWIESARTVRPRRRPETEEEADLRRGRGRVSPNREVAQSPTPCRAECESDDGGSEAASLWSADADGTSDLGCDDTSPSVKRKQSSRSLRKLLPKKLRSPKRSRATESLLAGEANAEPAAAGAPAEDTTPASPRPEATTDDDDRSHRRRGRAFPLPVLVPIILAGLVAGKLAALALAVLCAVLSSPVERVPGSGDLSQR